MRTWLLAVAIFLFAPAADARPRAVPAAAAINSAELAEVRAIFPRWEEAWNKHDAHAWAELFHEDGIWILWTGGEWKGRAAMAKGMGEAQRTFLAQSVQTSEPQEIKPVASGVVIARSLTSLTGNAREPQTIYGRKLLVLTRRNGRWGILFGQTTRLSEAEARALKR